ncbi:MAG: hypothetical protein KJO38_05090 [Gammaproteobacteria bacterium]|nr:hypothetical protein [Gammaproteobacteria bacterium]
MYGLLCAMNRSRLAPAALLLPGLLLAPPGGAALPGGDGHRADIELDSPGTTTVADGLPGGAADLMLADRRAAETRRYPESNSGAKQKAPGADSGPQPGSTEQGSTPLAPQFLAVGFLLLVLAMELRHLALRRRHRR